MTNLDLINKMKLEIFGVTLVKSPHRMNRSKRSDRGREGEKMCLPIAEFFSSILNVS